MSISHTFIDNRNRVAPTHAVSAMSATASAGQSVSGFVGGVITVFRHWRTLERFARFSDHRLQDVGFERDWDRSIHPVPADSRVP